MSGKIEYRIHKELRTCRCRNTDLIEDNEEKVIEKNIMAIKIVGASKEQMNWLEKQIVSIIKTVGCTTDEVLRWK